MTKSQSKIVMKKEREILKAKDAYYLTGNPIMSDEVYDALERSLKSICKDHPVLSVVGHRGSYKPLNEKSTMELEWSL